MEKKKKRFQGVKGAVAESIMTEVIGQIILFIPRVIGKFFRVIFDKLDF